MACRLFALLMAVLVLASPARATARTGFVTKMYTNPDGSRSPYMVFVPHHYHKRTSPGAVLLFLHGAGEVQGGATQPVDVGLGPYIKRHAQSFPFLVVFPQSEGADGWGPHQPSGVRALGILDAVIAQYKTNPKRVYVTGLSMGGEGTWQFAAAYPHRWAAIVPLCGHADPQTAGRIKHIPCWAFHGLTDDTVPVREIKTMIAALRKAGGHPKVTYFPQTGHTCWDRAYATPALWMWLGRQQRP